MRALKCAMLWLAAAASSPVIEIDTSTLETTILGAKKHVIILWQGSGSVLASPGATEEAAEARKAFETAARYFQASVRSVPLDISPTPVPRGRNPRGGSLLSVVATQLLPSFRLASLLQFDLLTCLRKVRKVPTVQYFASGQTASPPQGSFVNVGYKNPNIMAGITV